MKIVSRLVVAAVLVVLLLPVGSTPARADYDPTTNTVTDKYTSCTLREVGNQLAGGSPDWPDSFSMAFRCFFDVTKGSTYSSRLTIHYNSRQILKNEYAGIENVPLSAEIYAGYDTPDGEHRRTVQSFGTGLYSNLRYGDMTWPDGSLRDAGNDPDMPDNYIEGTVLVPSQYSGYSLDDGYGFERIGISSVLGLSMSQDVDHPTGCYQIANDCDSTSAQRPWFDMSSGNAGFREDESDFWMVDHPPHFPSQPEPDFPESVPPDVCEQIEVATQLDGEPLTAPSQWDGATVTRSSNLVILIAADVGSRAAGDFELSFRFGPQSVWTNVASTVIDEAELGNGSALTFSARVLQNYSLGALELRCDAPSSNLTYFWQTEHDQDLQNGWETLQTVGRACESLYLNQVEQDLEPGEQVSMSYRLDGDGDYSGGDAGIAGLTFAQTGGSIPPTSVDGSWSVYGSQTGGPPPFAYMVTPGNGIIRFTVPDGADPDANLSWLEFTCTDVIGDLSLRGQSEIQTTFSATLGSSSSCWSGIDISPNPLSWPGAGVRTIMCATEVMFVPTEAQIDERLERFNSMRAAPPLQWVDEGIGYVSGASFSFDTWANAGPGCSTILDQQVCPQDWDVTDVAPSWLVSAMAFGLWTLLVVAVWKWF